MGTMTVTGSSVVKQLALLAVLSLCTALPSQAQVSLTQGPERIAVEIDDAQRGICVEGHLPGFRQQRLALRRQPVEDDVH